MMFIFICVITGLMAAASWSAWAFGARVEFPVRLFLVALASTIVCVGSAFLAKYYDERIV
jgi:hypothetical protein